MRSPGWPRRWSTTRRRQLSQGLARASAAGDGGPESDLERGGRGGQGGSESPRLDQLADPGFSRRVRVLM